MRKKGNPQKRGRTLQEDPEHHGSDEATEVLQRRGSAKRSRVGAPTAPTRVQIAASGPEPEFLAFAELLLCVPHAGPDVGEAACRTASSGRAGTSAGVAFELALGQGGGASAALALTWNTAAGGPEVPVSTASWVPGTAAHLRPGRALSA